METTKRKLKPLNQDDYDFDIIKDLGMKFKNTDSKYKERFALFKCFCGKIFESKIWTVKNKEKTSCGCSKHNLSKTKIYGVWCSIKQRCLNPNDKSYINYGARGITICDDWESDFMAFYNWAMSNGYRERLEIDRINNDGNYEPSNCRWTTSFINASNKRIYKNNTTNYKGVTKAGDKFRARVQRNNKRISLGLFDCPKEAHIAREKYLLDNKKGHTK